MRVTTAEHIEAELSWERPVDKRTDPWLLVHSPVPVVVIYLIYLYVVRAGPRLMKHREPVDFLVTSILSNYSYLCQPVLQHKPTGNEDGECVLIELGDTVFFILRKKKNQLTLLHIYHHSTMILFSWSEVKYVAVFFTGWMNNFVHIVMYSYYGLAGLGPHMQKYLCLIMNNTWQRIQSIYQRTLENGVTQWSMMFPDKRTDPWLLVYSPVPVLIIILVYHCVVWAGPRLMKPVDLKLLLIAFNFAMVCMCVNMFQKVCMLVWCLALFLHTFHVPDFHLLKNVLCFLHFFSLSLIDVPVYSLRSYPGCLITATSASRLQPKPTGNEGKKLVKVQQKVLMDTAWQRFKSMYQWSLENGDKRTDQWLLVYSPIPVVIIILVYLCVVWAGPRLMKHREPVDLKGILIAYNFAMVCLSVDMFHEFAVLSRLSNYSYLCQPVDYSRNPLAMRMANVCWWFFFSKVIELSDTVFFILRKKNNQLSYLHVYHHTTMIFICWGGLKYVPVFVICLLNSFVHIIMYSYYGLAGLGPHMQKYLWWKRYLTGLQLVQFVLVITHTTYNLFAECDFPDIVNFIAITYCSSLIVLFSNFYYQSYLRKTKRNCELTFSFAHFNPFQMDTAWRSVTSAYRWTVENGDKRTDPWLLVYSPVPVVVIFLVYLCVVWAGPRLMKHREPVDLKGLLIAYNFAMVCLSVYMFHEFLVTSRLSNYSYLCQPVDYSTSPLAMRMANVCWWFFFSKVIELSDTVFFILRKKNNQLTFLHIYHHGTMIFNWWAGVKYVAGGQSFFIGLLNTFVHIIMYSYYGLAGLGPHMQKYLWWKRYLTSLQLVQFVLLTTHTGYNLFTECDYPDSMNVVVFGYCVSLIVLFSNFYYQSYLSKKVKRK
ncbi:Elongation of very long chain fatty acids protein 4 [Merluccius polli]|uniref:Elongation of very long chain fatty acids protein n=1 Tax=Merluccius polli TaxID=89951 RepID=A0AA47PB15_MERPO|nr:Elongation of very long chain fatty acids protein 4 [Merluccius polli]